MKQTHEKNNVVLDYTISTLMILIVVLATFMAPYVYSDFSDNRDMREPRTVEREDFFFNTLVEQNVEQRVQNLMEALNRNQKLPQAVELGSMEQDGGELLYGIKEAISIASSCKLIPDISRYEIEKHIVYADFYNIRDGEEESSELSFFRIRFSDYETFDFIFCFDASEYLIYQAEIYCAEASEYSAQITSDDKEVVEFYNNQFVENAERYFEVEGYDVLTDITQSDLAVMFGYERGEFALYHTSCHYGNLDSDGLRWGFVPMAEALSGGSATKEWDNKTIRDYFKEKYDIEVNDSYVPDEPKR